MAANYEPNRWELFNPEIPYEEQPHAFITKRKLDKIEEGIEEASVELEVGSVSMGESYGVTISEEETPEGKVTARKLNVIFPPAGQGDPGDDGKSAYDIWIEAGNIGTEQDFLDYLKGIDGKDGVDGKDGSDGAPGPKGDSAYQSWLNEGNTGTEEDFLKSIKGEMGKSAYEVWLESGNTGTEAQFLKSLQGDEGDSAYELWLTIPGNENKTIEDFFNSLKGEKGDPGEGSGVQIEWVDFGNITSEE